MTLPSFVRRNWCVLALVGWVGLGIGRITSTYAHFDQVWDEPSHVAAGLEWLQYGRFSFEPMHPPLPRVAVALGPYLGGVRLGLDERPDSMGLHSAIRTLFEFGTAALESGQYDRNLRLARFGTLPFFVLACFVTWAWTRRLFGDAAAVTAAGVFTHLPIVLANAGIATTDMAATCMIALGLFAWTTFWRHPSLPGAALTGTALGLALVTKMSAVVFLPPSLLATFAAYRWLRGAGARGVVPGALGRGKRWRPALLLAGCAALTIWASYRFSIGSARDVDPRFVERIANAFGERATVTKAAAVGAEWRCVPAWQLAAGVKDLRFYNSEGRKGYLAGRIYTGGKWLFFPVGILVKTPIATLILFAIGVGAAMRWGPSERRWEYVGLAAIPAVFIAVVVPAGLNIGVRHILPAFPFIAALAGAGLVKAWRESRHPHLSRSVVALLLAWQAFTMIRIAPDYLPYFNELTLFSRQPVLLDSDLDWGQDLRRLTDTLRALRVDSLTIAYHGSADLAKRGLPPFRVLQAYTPVKGWVAISRYKLIMGIGTSPRSDHYAWLRAYEPAVRVGHSILLYRID